MRYFFFALSLLLVIPSTRSQAQETIVEIPPVKLGIDVLVESQFAELQNKKVGLVIHPASVDSSMVSTLDRFLATDKCKVVAIFGPEHGVYGDEYAGVEIPNRKDAITGLPIFSLYGKSRKPAPEMLKGLDALVFDLQDIGSRSYTYISSMKLCLEACADNNVDFYILDRPNPLGGLRIEGPMVEKPFESFVSPFGIPYIHGMTMGELATMFQQINYPAFQKLHVIKMTGWQRSYVWEDTHLNWIPTSPHIPHASVCAAYAATGILGELEQISVGVGYPQPFELVGAPWMKAEALSIALNQYWKNARDAYALAVAKKPFSFATSSPPRGLIFQKARFKPFYAIFKEVGCQGVQLIIDPKSCDNLVEFNFKMIEVLDAPKLFSKSSPGAISMFDKVCGTDEPRKWLSEKKDLEALFLKWRQSSNSFEEFRDPFLLY